MPDCLGSRTPTAVVRTWHGASGGESWLTRELYAQLRKLGAVVILGPGRRAVGTDIGEVGTFQVRARQVGSPQISAVQDGLPQVGVFQMCVAQVGVRQPGTSQEGVTEIDVHQLTAFQVAVGHVGTGQIRMAQIGTRQLRFGELYAAQIRSRQIQGVFVRMAGAAAQYIQGGLHIWGPGGQPGHLAVHCGCGVFRPVGSANRPSSVLTDERAQNIGDGGSVVGRVLGDPLKGVDASEPYIECFAAEVIDRAGEAFRHLPFAGELELLPASDCAREYNQPTHGLQQLTAEVVLYLGLGLLQFDALRCAWHVTQLARREGWIDHPGKPDDRSQSDQYSNSAQCAEQLWMQPHWCHVPPADEAGRVTLPSSKGRQSQHAENRHTNPTTTFKEAMSDETSTLPSL